MGTQKILEVLVMFLVDDLVVHFATKPPSLGMCCYLLSSLYLHWFYSKWHISICVCAWHNKCYWLLVVPLKGYDSHHITEEHLGGKIISRSVLLCAFEGVWFSSHLHLYLHLWGQICKKCLMFNYRYLTCCVHLGMDIF